MSEAITPIITDAGLQAVFNTHNDGVQAVISHIALGDVQWTPDQTATGLRAEQQRVPIAEGARVQSHQIHVVALADNNDATYWVNELGFYLEDGTLLAIWASEDEALAWKSSSTDLSLAFDLVLKALPPDSVTVNVMVDPSHLQLAEELTQMATAQIKEILRGMRMEMRVHALEKAIAA